MRAKAAHGFDGRSEYDSTDSAGPNGIGAHETGFGARVKRASRQVKRLHNLASPTNGFHLSVMGNVVLRSDAFDSLADHGAVAHNDRAHWNFAAFASNSGQFQTQAHIRFMQRVSHLFHRLVLANDSKGARSYRRPHRPPRVQSDAPAVSLQSGPFERHGNRYGQCVPISGAQHAVVGVKTAPLSGKGEIAKEHGTGSRNADAASGVAGAAARRRHR